MSAIALPDPSPLPGLVRTARGWAVVLLVCLVVALIRWPALGAVPGELRDWVVALTCLGVGSRLAAHSPGNAVGWLLLAIASAAALGVGFAAFPASEAAAWLGVWTWPAAYTLLPVAALIFPDGHPTSRLGTVLVIAALVGTASVMLGLAVAAWASPLTFWTDAVAGQGSGGWPVRLVTVGVLLTAVAALGAVVTLVTRVRRSGAHRVAARWAALCAGLTLLAVVLEMTGVPAAWWMAALVLPATTVVGVVRYGLFDVDLVIHRSVLFGGSMLALTAVYAAVALVVGQVAPEPAHVLAAVAVVVAVAPVHARLKGWVDRALFGARSEPYKALADLGRRLEGNLPPDEVLPVVVHEVAAALKAPFVSLELSSVAGTTVQAGRSRGWPAVSVTLTFRGSSVGRMTVEARAADESYDARERALLADLARGAAAAAHAVVLTDDLRAARERLVLAREEERRSVRRDLHDGVGAALVGLGMQLTAAERLLPPEARPAGELLTAAVGDVRATTVEVRRLIDGLRPAVLDAGLHAALRSQLERFAATSLRVELVADADDLVDLPAAVEVAAFHIVGEALSNAARHAHATRCCVTVHRSQDRLLVEVADDGTGIAAGHLGQRPIDGGIGGGVGLASLHDRAVELGGGMAVDTTTGEGTRLRVWLPLISGPVARPPTVVS